MSKHQKTNLVTLRRRLILLIPKLGLESYEARVKEKKEELRIVNLRKKKKQLMIGGAVDLILILLIIIIVLISTDCDGTRASVGIGAASRSNMDRNNYKSHLVSAMKGETSMFDNLGRDTAHVRALNCLKKDHAAQAFANSEELDLLLEQYVLTLSVFMSSAHEWFDFLLPKHDSYCGDLGIECNEDGRVTGLSIDSFDYTGAKAKIPTEIGFLTKLEYFKSVDFKGLIGTIPTEVGLLSALTLFTVGMAGFTGTIPTEIGQLREMSTFFLHELPHISGTVPTELGRLDKAWAISMSNMNLSGSIPSEIGKLTSVSWFRFENMDLSGSIPTEVGRMTELTSLKLSGLGLSGTIPSEIETLGLYTLNLDQNALTGSVPSLFQSDDGCRFNPPWSDSYDYRSCYCDLSHNSFSNNANGISVGCKV